MVLNKKPAKSPKKTDVVPVSLEESVTKEERKPSVTQVVEVVEDESPMEQSVASEQATPEVPLEEVVDAVEPKDPVESAAASSSPKEEALEDKGADEKRKVLVDELFQKKPLKSSGVTPEISMHTKRTTKPVMLWAIGMITMCFVIGGALLLLSGKAGSLASIVVIPTPTPSPTPQATPTPTPGELTRDALSIQVLNGGGVVGAATKMKQALEDKGYTVTDTGNAASYTYDKTEILVKASKKEYISLLEEDLKESYTLGSSAATLEDDVDYDARVIVGKE